MKARIALLGDFALNYNYHPKGGRAADLNAASHFLARFLARFLSRFEMV